LQLTENGKFFIHIEAGERQREIDSLRRIIDLTEKSIQSLCEALAVMDKGEAYVAGRLHELEEIEEGLDDLKQCLAEIQKLAKSHDPPQKQL
jgi:hypothetical protein